MALELAGATYTEELIKLDVQGRSVFTFRQGCSYRMRLEAWFAHDHAAMGPASSPFQCWR